MTNKKKYKKYRNCTLPFYYYDEEKHVSNWVHYDGNDFSENVELYEAFSQILGDSLEYHYEIAIHYYDIASNCLKTDIEVLHSHNFNDVIEAIYTHPESFNIPKKYYKDYSENEIEFIGKLKNYLILIGLKDKTDSIECINLQRKYSKALGSKKYLRELGKLLEKEDFARISNDLVLKYQDVMFLSSNDDIVEAILKRKKKTRIFRQYEDSISRVGFRFFVLDKDYKFRALIEITREKILPFKELRDNTNDYLLNGFETFEDYTKHLFKEFSKDNTYKCKFNENSLISIASFKVIEKF